MKTIAELAKQLRDLATDHAEEINGIAEELENYLKRARGPRDPTAADIDRVIALLERGDKPGTIAVETGLTQVFVNHVVDTRAGRLEKQKEEDAKKEYFEKRKERLLACGKICAEGRAAGKTYEQIIGTHYMQVYEIKEAEKLWAEYLDELKALENDPAQG